MARLGTEEVTYRGIRWRRSPGGKTLWFNEGLRRWVVWSPGSDAPPLPEAWRDDPIGTGGPEAREPVGYLPEAMRSRPKMTSPWRVAPIAMTLFVVAIAVYQATRPAHASRRDVSAAESLAGKCLARTGGTARSPTFSTVPVSCSSPSAAAKVLAVHLPNKGATCPAGTDFTMVLQPGLEGEPFECLAALHRPR
jgi:hypothetical protein